MCGLAVARLGLSVEEFYMLSPAEYYFAMREFGKQKEQDMQIQYEVMRQQTMYLINIQVKESSRIYELERFMPFSWDKKQKRKQTVEEMKQIMMSIARRQNKSVKKHKK